MARNNTGPWHSFTISGAVRKVRMVRQYEGSGGAIWRDYQNERGQVICIRARRGSARRSAPEARTARLAAKWSAGNL